MLKNNEVDIIALFETHAEGPNADKICRNIGFTGMARVDAQGQSEGIWLLWREDKVEVEVDVVHCHQQFIHARVKVGRNLLHLIPVYACPTPSRRKSLWQELKATINPINEPLFVGGDFNTIMYKDERQGGSGNLSPDSKDFAKWASDLCLIDMGFTGPNFTWTRGSSVETRVAKRLDRAFTYQRGRTKWTNAMVTHLPSLASDHNPLLLALNPPQRVKPSRRPFRFEAAWFSHPDFKRLIDEKWNQEAEAPRALEELREASKRWNIDTFGNIFSRKKMLFKRIKGA